MTPNIKISSTSDVQTLVDHLILAEISPNSTKSRLIRTLNNFKSDENDKMVVFLQEQIRNLGISPNNHRYSLEFFLICIKMSIFSLKLYRTLRKFNILTLPHPDNIRKYFSDINVSTDNQDENLAYLKEKIHSLNPIEKEFILMIDEIHIKPKAELHLEYGFYGIDSKDDKLARNYKIAP